jgi:cell division protein FtsW
MEEETIKTKNTKPFLRGDLTIWIIVLLLSAISVIEVFSASSRLTFGRNNYWAPILGHCVHLTIGLGVMYTIHRLNYRWYKLVPYILIPLSAILLGYLFLKGRASAGAARWIDLGFINLQPSELAKLAVIMTVASWLSKMKVNDELSQIQTFWKIIILTASFCLIILLENLSTAILLGTIILMMMIIGCVSWKRIGILMMGCFGFAGLIGGLMFIIPPAKFANLPLPERATTWQARVLDFAAGEQKQSPREYALTTAKDKPQETHANIAIATSHIFGKGPGNSDERDFVQEASCDFIYAIIIEELGMVGGILVLFLYILLMFRAGKIASKCKKKYPAYLTMGMSLMLGLQALINMSVAVGLIPVTGQPLPLISKGGTSVLLSCIYIGIILGVSNSLEEERLAGSVGRESEETDLPEIISQEEDKFGNG